MLKMKEKTIKWIAVWLAGLLLIGFCSLSALALPEDEEEGDPTTSEEQTMSTESIDDEPSSTTTSEKLPASSYHQTSSQSHTTSNSTTTSSREASSSSRETTTTTTTSRASTTGSTVGQIGGINDQSVTASWGTGYTESSGAATTTSSAAPGRKNIANYAELMQKMIWLPILLIILSVATLLFVNLRAGKRNGGRKRRSMSGNMDIRSDSRRRRR